ncbi:hypothetical protein F5Y18DRAFT_2506 [Xylariaceae sp. FL1019]|nr:hypothetical protein F5Y18DRAFT_2506 [Xylariaceae sp. FL1019]
MVADQSTESFIMSLLAAGTCATPVAHPHPPHPGRLRTGQPNSLANRNIHNLNKIIGRLSRPTTRDSAGRRGAFGESGTTCSWCTCAPMKSGKMFDDLLMPSGELPLKGCSVWTSFAQASTRLSPQDLTVLADATEAHLAIPAVCIQGMAGSHHVNRPSGIWYYPETSVSAADGRLSIDFGSPNTRDTPDHNVGQHCKAIDKYVLRCFPTITEG